MAFTSATVVNSLTAFASLQCDEGGFDVVTGKIIKEHPQLAKGKALGEFRSSGQLGRALGPLLGPSFYLVALVHLQKSIDSLRVLLDFRPFLHLHSGVSGHVYTICNYEGSGSE